MENKITTIEINDGFIEPKVLPEDYVYGEERSIENKLGSLGIADEIIRPDGQWDAGLPGGEVQSKLFESFNCTSFNSLNQLEIMMKVIYNL